MNIVTTKRLLSIYLSFILYRGLRIEIEESALYAVMSDIRKDNMVSFYYVERI